MTTERDKPRVNLSDEDGNVFFIIGRCRRIARRAGWSANEINKFTIEMKSGDYDHALQTVYKYFDVE